jgi:plasmid stabilization system protein ParE
MDDYRLVVTSRAERDADDIYAWIARHSPDGATKWYAAFLKMLGNLQKDPVRHARAPEAANLGLDIQQALFKTRSGHAYRALYTLAGDTLHVIAVRGAGEDLIMVDDVDLPM